MKDSDRSYRPRLRVLMISQRMPPHIAGAELQALGLSRALIRLGVDVRIATTRFSSGLRAHEIIEGVEVRRLPVLRANPDDSPDGPLAAKASIFASAASYVATHRRDYDIVHGHCLSTASIGAAMGARIARRPVLIKPSLGGADGEISKIVGSPFAKLATGLLRGVDRFAVLDSGIAQELAELGVRRDRLTSVPNGLDLERFKPATCEERKQIRARLNLPSGQIALFVGQIIRRKGVDRLLEAWRDVVASVDDAWLIFVGEGELSQAVREQAALPGSRILYFGVRRD
ncbi:MAG TPA: glycosyltransferase family 4 protein, partial [Blastocatellia bacterium]|nr:glycosyltransferase family 4 protein [Blastocatellia bacterium]